MLETAISKTKNIGVQVREETIRDYIIKSIKEIKKLKQKTNVDFIIDKAINDGLNPTKVVHELNKMKNDKCIFFEGEKIKNGTVEIFLQEGIGV